MTTPLERLRAIARAMPTTDQAAAKRQADAQQALALGAVGAAAQRPGGVTAAQVAGAATQVAQAQAQPAVAAAAASQDKIAKIAQTGIRQQAEATQTSQQSQLVGQQAQQADAARAAQAQVSEADRSQKLQFTQAELAQQAELQRQGLEFDKNLSFLTDKQRADLSRLGRDVKAELFDKRLQFDRDEAGRKFNNDRQLWDFNVATAKSEEQLKSRQQDLIQAHERKSLLLSRAYDILIQQQQIAFAQAEQRKDHESKRKIAEYIRDLKKKQADTQSKANKRAMVLQSTAAGAAAGSSGVPGYGTAIGAGVGFVVGMAAAGGPSEVI